MDFELNYDNAWFDNHSSYELDADETLEFLLETSSGVNEELTVLSDNNHLDSETIDVRGVSVEDGDGKTINVNVHVSGITVGTQPSRGRHSSLKFRLDGPQNYKIGIKPV